MKLASFLHPLIACLAAAAAPALHAQAPQDAPPPAAPAAPAQTPSYAAEVLRKTYGRQIDASGLATKPYPVEKGATFDLVSQSFSEVIVKRGNVQVRLSKNDVRIFEKDPNAPAPVRRDQLPGMIPDPRAIEAERAAAAQAAEAAAIAAFKPGGVLVIVSARYSLTGNSPRNVKNKIEKMVPAGPLTAPVKIAVNDQLHRSAANEPEAIVYTGRDRVNVVELRKNVLTVVYEYNGQKLTKQAEEGTNMILP